MPERRYIGAAVERAEDLDLVRGVRPFVADLDVDGCLEACFVRSYAAHGAIDSIAVGAAREVPGVVGVYRAADLDLAPVPVPPLTNASPAMARPALATDRVRFVGEPLAVVIGTDRYRAEDGAEVVIPEIDPLDAVLDPATATTGDAPRLFDGLSNVVSVREYGEPVDRLFDSAPVVVETTIRNGRVVPTSIEARAILVRPTPEGRIDVWVSHQAPQRLRKDLAAALNIDAERVRVVVPQVGGAFGAKSQTFPEYIVVARLALALNRPIRWTEDRREALMGATHGRGQNQKLRLAATADGRLLALQALITADVGAYPHTGEFVPSMTAWVLSGPYRIPDIRIEVRAVVTNTTPTASYRGAGRPEATFALERLMDKLARTTGIDPVTIRLRNFIAPHDFPYRSPTGAVYDSGNHERALKTALRVAGYDELRAERDRRRRDGGTRLGIGIASYVERSGGQSGSMEFGSVEVTADGTIVARSGATPQGQGHATAFAQVVASAFEIPMDLVRVVQGDTVEVPVGVGTFASRSMQVGGSALHAAARELLDEARLRASQRLEVAAEDLHYEAGRFRIAGTQKSVDLVALLADGPLAAESRFAPEQAFPFGSHVAVAEIDDATGAVRIVRLVAVDDCGTVVNPAIVDGQVTGSVVQGLGQALYEGVDYDELGQPQMSSLMDYSLPTVAEVPDIILGESVTPNPNVPLGTKGAGESGCIAAPPAIVNAIVDALDGYDEGIDMPVTSEKVWRALETLRAVRGPR